MAKCADQQLSLLQARCLSEGEVFASHEGDWLPLHSLPIILPIFTARRKSTCAVILETFFGASNSANKAATPWKGVAAGLNRSYS